MKRFRLWTALLGLVGAAALSLVSPGGLVAQEHARLLKWATFPPGSVNNVMTSAMASVTDKYQGTSSRVASYTGYRDYVPRIDEGKVDFGIVNSLEAWGAYHGQEPFYHSHYRDLRILRAAPAGKNGILVRADSKYKTIDDLKGAKVAGGYAAHMSCRILARAVLATGGLTAKDVTVVPMATVLPGIRALMDGRVDAATCAAPGMPIVREADARVGVRWLPIDTSAQAVRRMKEVFPGAFVDHLNPGQAPGVTKTVAVLGYHYYVISSTHTDENIIYQVTKTLWDHDQDLFKINPQLKYWKDNQAVQSAVAIPYHPGAIRFYKEKGVWTPEMERIQEKLLAGK